MAPPPMTTDRRDLAARLRQEPSPEGAALVVRGGPVSVDKLRTHAQRTHRTFALHGEPVWGISVFCALDDVGGSSLDAILSELLGSYRTVHLPKVESVIAGGFELLPTFDRPHFTVRLRSADDAEISRLIEAFGTSQRNPYYRSRQEPRS